MTQECMLELNAALLLPKQVFMSKLIRVIYSKYSPSRISLDARQSRARKQSIKNRAENICTMWQSFLFDH